MCNSCLLMLLIYYITLTDSFPHQSWKNNNKRRGAGFTN